MRDRIEAHDRVRAVPNPKPTSFWSSFAKWQLPDAFVFVEALPRTSVGKFKKIALREKFADWKWE
jgi:acyl-CoA synthetase (AMP-forming)/AMP-acid ligase II